MQKLSAVVLVFFVLVSVATLGYSEKEEGSGKGHETRKLLSKRNALKGLRDGSANMLEESPVRGSTILMQIREHVETSLLKKKGGKKKGGKKKGGKKRGGKKKGGKKVRGRKDRKSKSRRKKKGKGRRGNKKMRRGRKRRRGRRRGRGSKKMRRSRKRRRGRQRGRGRVHAAHER